MTHSDNAFVIKVGDLLRNPGQIDTIPFDHLMIDDIHWLSSAGVSGILTIQGVNDGSVKVVIKEVKARVSDICDLSGEDYERDIIVHDFDGRFSSDVAHDDDNVIYDELFPLDAHGETINIYDLLLQSIQLQEPIVHIKPGKEYLLEEYTEDEDDEELPPQSGNVVFH